MTASERLASFIATLRFDDLPPSVVDAAKRYLLDTFGVAIGGTASKPGRVILNFLQESLGPQEATVVGTDLRASRAQAAFGNGALIRALEMEDTFDELLLHAAPGAIGAPLALVEHHRCTGKELLTAVSLGYEVGARVAWAVAPSHAARGYHPTGTCGTFGAVAAAARLMGLSEEQTVAAFAIAGIRAAGLMQDARPGWRYLSCVNGGSAAQIGVVSTLLARHGVPGSPHIFEDELGFCATHADAWSVDAITDGLGVDYRMLRGGIKLFPASRPNHTSIAAVLELRRRHNVDADAVAEVVVRTFSVGARLSDKPDPPTELDGQSSQQFTLAVAMTRGRYTVADVTDATLRDPAVRKLMAKIRVEADSELDAERVRHPAKWPTVVEIRMADGTVHRQRVDYPPGAAEEPPTAQQMAEKFTSLATKVLPASRARELRETVEGLEHVNDLAQLARLWEAPR